jgi:uroporphyrinogen-III synthase
MRLLVTRPRPDADTQAERLRAMGHEALAEPLIEIVNCDIGRLPLEGVQALVATSRNGLRALARNEALESARKLPLFAVGPATASLGEALGIRRIHVCDGRATDMADRIARECAPGAGCILHLAGSRLASDLKGDMEALGFRVEQPRLYESVRVPALSDELVTRLAADGLDGVLLMSPFTARSWVELVREARVSDQAMHLRHYCLSDAVAEGLDGFAAGQVAVAQNPSEDDLLALIDRETAD